MYVTINKEIFKVKVCKTKSETQRGMMGREFIGFDGMLFFMGKHGRPTFTGGYSLGGSDIEELDFVGVQRVTV